METERRYVISIAAMALAFALGVFFLVWPNYRASGSIQSEIAALRGKLDTLGSQTATVEKLATEIAAARAAMQRDLKSIPDSADVAGLMSQLSLPLDGIDVIDQTFTAGVASPAIVGADDGPQRQPITVDMTGSFKAIFALIDRAESMSRLIRVANVRISRQPDPADSGFPRLRASISLEAIFKSGSRSLKEQ